MENAIVVKDVTKIYKLYDKPIDRLKESLHPFHKEYHKKFYALNGLSFTVEKGQTVGIIGTNGSGKSTILKIITGVLSPSSGEVTVNGTVSALLELGAGFNMDYTGIENIYMNGSMMGFTRKEMDAKLADILEFADIGDFVYQPVKTYSSGMFVRLAFALAINVDPEILIVDEALSVGDVFFQSKCYRRMEEIRQRGTTILMVTHDMGSIIKYCDKVVLINKGNFIAEGAAGHMVDLYKKILANQMDSLEEELAREREQTAGDETKGVPEGLEAGTRGKSEDTEAGTRGVPEKSEGRTTEMPEESGGRTTEIPEGAGAGTAGAAERSRFGQTSGSGQTPAGRISHCWPDESAQTLADSPSEQSDDGNGSAKTMAGTEDVPNGRKSRSVFMKDRMTVNPNRTEYGDGRAEIYDMGLFDERGNLTNLLLKGEHFTIREKIRFHAPIQTPIFTYTIRDKKGTDLTGTNTMYEGTDIRPVKEGDEYEVSFTQKMTLQGGEYLLSMSCTGFEQGEHVVYHRLYDVLSLTVISNKNTVGVYDMESEVEAEKKTVRAETGSGMKG